MQGTRCRRTAAGGWLAITCALVAGVLALIPGVAGAADPPDPGKTTLGTTTSNGTPYPYRLYTPTTYRPGHLAPLIVLVHGCQTTAEQEQRITLYDELAERYGFAVLYPEVDAVEGAQQGPTANCWTFAHPADYFRGNGDPAAIADMTRAIMSKLAIDPQRVYLIGVSAGGLMASADAAEYPEIYAAVGIVESAGYADGTCFTSGVGIPVEASAQLAFEQMGPRARVVPTFVTGSTGDLAFPQNCANKALEQGLRTDNLVISGNQDKPIRLTPAAVREARVPRGRAYAVSTYRDPNGCLVGEKTIIDWMPHAWPGGSTDLKWKGYTDPQAPSAAEMSWAFFRRWTKSSPAMPCAELKPPSAAPRCRARWLLVRLPAGLRRTTATVNGKRAAVRKARGGVLVRIPAGARTRTAVVVKGHTVCGRPVTRRHTYRGCGA